MQTTRSELLNNSLFSEKRDQPKIFSLGRRMPSLSRILGVGCILVATNKKGCAGLAHMKADENLASKQV